MTETPDVWKMSSVTDAARARAALERIATDGRAPARERARFLIALTSRLRHCLDQGGEWELRLDIRRGTATRDHHLDVSLRPTGTADSPGSPGSTGRADQPRLSCPLPHPPAEDALRSAPPLHEALLHADDNTEALLDLLTEQEDLVRLHREELHHTNQGVLALHSELEAAAGFQRELLEAERTARAEAEQARRLLTFLADASAAITVSLSHTAVLRRLSDMLIPDYAAHLDVWLFDEENEGDDGPAQRSREHSAAAVAAARTGRPQHAAPHPGFLPGVDDLPASVLSPERPLLAIPLVAHRLLGVVTLTAPGPRFDPDASVMLVELVRRVAVALDNARSYERYRDTAEALQRAQLTELPAASGLLLTARYLPAAWGMNIGGDWYDAFLQPDGSLLAVIGDVTGHGLHAAVVMGQLRTALRAYAIESNSPGEILTRLHRMLRHLQPELYATAMIARFRPGEPQVVWSSAGHPPAVVRGADGTVRVLDTKPGVMLGIPVEYEYEDHRADLPVGSSLVLYTDGLVERRAEGIDRGIERLGQALGALSPPELEQDPDAAADALLKPLLHDSERDDDVCLLLCHTVAPTDRKRGEEEPVPSARTGPPASRRSRGSVGGRQARGSMP
ncbi:PP2C family protein-serine/threonine phosphatase [Streptomyces sp. NPDC001595]|uniref:PP2C family protein-serine/threonine phosphatase n=1 Tax=Streptomyces sp. NPDC001532 TaxID=3154520 RepID=UPI00332D31EB